LGFKLFYSLLEPSVVQKKVVESVTLGSVATFLLKIAQDILGSSEDGHIDSIYDLISLCRRRHKRKRKRSLHIRLLQLYGTVRRRAWTGPSGEGRMGPLHLIFVYEGASSSGVPRAVKRAGGWGRTQAPCGLPLTPYTGDLSCGGNSGAGIFAAKSPGGTGSLTVIRGHEISCTVCFPG